MTDSTHSSVLTQYSLSTHSLSIQYSSVLTWWSGYYSATYTSLLSDRQYSLISTHQYSFSTHLMEWVVLRRIHVPAQRQAVLTLYSYSTLSVLISTLSVLSQYSLSTHSVLSQYTLSTHQYSLNTLSTLSVLTQYSLSTLSTHTVLTQYSLSTHLVEWVLLHRIHVPAQRQAVLTLYSLSTLSVLSVLTQYSLSTLSVLSILNQYSPGGMGSTLPHTRPC